MKRPRMTADRMMVLAVAFAAALGLAGPAAAQPLDEDEGPSLAEPQLVDPQPAPDSLVPGLAVTYWLHMVRHVDEIVDWKKYRDGTPGEPLPKLAYRGGLGEVLTSGYDDGVLAEITGLIRLDKVGSYFIAAETNDGFQLTIGGAVVVNDPDVHADRFSDPVEMLVTTPGWYELHAYYFERKNTNTLKLHWLEPGSDGGTMPVVPAEVFAHIPSQ